MAKRSYTKTPMREQAPEIRNQNFSEVALGYTLEEGQLEATRCLQCKNAPCIQNCPVMIDIPGFIKHIEVTIRSVNYQNRDCLALIFSAIIIN